MRTSTRQVLSLLVGVALASGCSADALHTVTPTDPSNPDLSETVATVTISPSTGQVEAGKTLQISATALNDKGKPVSDATVAWKVDNDAVATISTTGLLTGVAAGSVKVTASSGSVSASSSFTVQAASSDSSSTSDTSSKSDTSSTSDSSSTANNDWTFCTQAGALCQFFGLRDVRLAGPDGHYVEQTAYHLVPCATYGFGGQNPAPGKTLHCDYGTLKTTTLANPMPGMAGLAAQVIVPLGSPGAAGPQAAATNEQPVFTDGSGSFRTTCSLAHFSFDDPIVYPGRPGASHLHEFFGNTSADANTTAENIRSEGHSTCRGGTLNMTAYWTPAVFDSRTGVVQTPDEGVFYYKTGYNIDPKVVQPMPTGLRMIAGNSQSTGQQEFVSWGCKDGAAQNKASIPTTCSIGDAVRLTVIFPQCWDGVHLDSPDHKSHMAYPDYRNPPQRSTCPASHPITLPEVTEHFDYPISAASAPQFWRLSSDMYSTSLPGGLSAHADWMMGWDPATMKTIATKCLDAAVDCGVGSIGNGTTLY